MSYASTPDTYALKTFYRLGYQSGSIISEEVAKRNGCSMQEALSALPVTRRLGDVNFMSYNNTGSDTVSIMKNDIKAGTKTVQKDIVASIPSLSIREEKFRVKPENITIGWMNPY